MNGFIAGVVPPTREREGEGGRGRERKRKKEHSSFKKFQECRSAEKGTGEKKQKTLSSGTAQEIGGDGRTRCIVKTPES